MVTCAMLQEYSGITSRCVSVCVSLFDLGPFWVSILRNALAFLMNMIKDQDGSGIHGSLQGGFQEFRHPTSECQLQHPRQKKTSYPLPRCSVFSSAKWSSRFIQHDSSGLVPLRSPLRSPTISGSLRLRRGGGFARRPDGEDP